MGASLLYILHTQTYGCMCVCRGSKSEAFIQEELALTEALRLKEVGLLHADVAAPGQEVGGVVTGKEGTWRGTALERHFSCGKQLDGE